MTNTMKKLSSSFTPPTFQDQSFLNIIQEHSRLKRQKNKKKNITKLRRHCLKYRLFSTTLDFCKNLSFRQQQIKSSSQLQQNVIAVERIIYDKMEAIEFDPVKGQLEFVRKNFPRKPLSNEVLIRVAFAGVCGTDLHISQGEFPCSSTKFVLGHEFSGIAEVVGENVTHIMSGDKVVVDPNSGCHTCTLCTSGKYHLCNTKAINDTIGIFKDGGWAEFCLVPGFQTYKIPEGISLEQAALTEPFSCLAHGWNRISPVRVGQNILIQGAGIIGNLWAATFHLQGHKRVTVSEPIESRRKIAEKLGTGYKCVDPSELKNFPADLIIDCSGSFGAIESALDLLSPGGKLCIFGVAPPDSKISISPYEIYKRELTIVGVMINPFTFPEAFGLMEAMGSKYLDYDHLGVQVFALKDFESALESLKSGKIAKAVFNVAK